jgi:RNA polymerase sigma-70 factor (ECF subfamily)
MKADDPKAFAATRWTLVRRASGKSPEASAALAELCAASYEPVRAFIRTWCRDDGRADDLTQDFFAEILGHRGIAGADPERGKFRTFLLGAVKHFLSRVREKERAQKRGGGRIPESLDAVHEIEDSSLPPDAAFDRQWALALIARSLLSLEAHAASEGKATQFAVLRDWLSGEARRPQSAAAAELGMTEAAVKVAIHRWRLRFRRELRKELEATLDASESADAELRHLLAVLS